MAEKQDKGNDFLTHSFLRNTAFAKQENVSAQNRNLGIFSTKGIKELFNITKELRNINKNLLTQKASANKKDFVRREDTNLKLIKEVDDLEELMKENNKLQKKKSSGLLGMIGNIAKMGLVGGLVGYLLFGDNKYIKAARDMFKKVGGFIWDGIKWVGKKIKDWWNSGGDKFTLGIMNSIKDGLITGIKGIWEWAKNNPELAIGGGLIGALLTGNIGGLAKLATSLATLSFDVMGQMVKHPGFALVLASAAAIAYAGFKAKEVADIVKETKEKEKSQYADRTTSWKDRSVAQNWKMEDKQRLDEILGQETQLQNALYGTTQGSFSKRGARVKKVGKQMGLFDPGRRPDVALQFAPTGKWTDESRMQALQYEYNRLGKTKGSMAKQYGSYTSMRFNEDPNEIYPGIKLADSSVDIENLNPPVRKKLLDLGEAFKAKYPDKSIVINSGYRTHEKQKQLYANAPDKSKVAFPGKSPHEFGYAVDIQTKGSEGFDDWSLATSKGFQRPIASKEPWHTEYGQHGTTVDSGEYGDPVNNNLPRSTIERIMKGEQNVPIDLSEKTITLLADALGMSMKGVMPKGSTPRVSFDTSMRS